MTAQDLDAGSVLVIIMLGMFALGFVLGALLGKKKY